MALRLNLLLGMYLAEFCEVMGDKGLMKHNH